MRVFSVILASAVAASLCTPTLAQTTELTVAVSSQFKAMYEEVARTIEGQVPGVRLSLVAGPVEDDELIQQTLRSAVTGTLPDLMFMSNNRLRLLAERELAQPLDSFLAQDPTWQSPDFASPADSIGRIGASVYGLPFGFSAPVVMFNLDLVKRAGGDPESLPKTWPEIVALGRRMQDVAPGIVGCYFEYDSSGNWTFISLIDSLGGRMMSADEKRIAFNGPEGLRALEILRAFGEAGQAKVDMTRLQARQAFAAGSVGVLVTTSSALTNFERGAAGKFEPRLQPFPISTPGGGVAASGPVVLLLTKDSTKQKAAWAVMKAALAPQAQALLASRTGFLPLNRRAIQDSQYLGRQFQENENLRRLLTDVLPTMKPWYTFPEPNSVRITASIKDHLQSVVTLRATPEQAMASMVRDVEPLLPR